MFYDLNQKKANSNFSFKKYNKDAIFLLTSHWPSRVLNLREIENKIDVKYFQNSFTVQDSKEERRIFGISIKNKYFGEFSEDYQINYFN